MAQCTSLDTSQDIQHIMHHHEQEDDEDDDDEKDDGDDDDVVTVHANACVSPDLLHLKHPETPQEPQTLKDPLSDPSRPPDNQRASRMCQHILYSKTHTSPSEEPHVTHICCVVQAYIHIYTYT